MLVTSAMQVKHSGFVSYKSFTNTKFYIRIPKVRCAQPELPLGGAQDLKWDFYCVALY